MLHVSILFSFMLLSNSLWYVYIRLFNHLPIERHVDCFQFGTMSVPVYIV